jgi:hypothetical protein
MFPIEALIIQVEWERAIYWSFALTSGSALMTKPTDTNAPAISTFNAINPVST